ncbi:MAG: thiamine pyrophosphate-dependent enzyme [Verrucomicrobiales bacterium]
MHGAIERAHNESRPSVVEIDTYRYYGHSVADAKAKEYRTEEEIERYKQNHDPIRIWRTWLIEEGVLDDETADAMDKEARKEAEASAKFAEESPFPEVEDITKGVYWEVDNETEAARREPTSSTSARHPPPNLAAAPIPASFA